MPSKKLYLLLLLSILLNIAQFYYLGVLNYKLIATREQIKALTEENSKLKKSVRLLEKELNITKSLLDYYRQFEKTSGVGASTGALEGKVSVNLVAVKAVPSDFFFYEYVGVVLKAEVEIRRGEGRILVNTEPRIGIDLQSSLRAAVQVAESLTGRSIKSYDLIVTVKGKEEVEVVDGPSAGAALTAAIIAALEGKKLRSDVYVTGTINPDGSIGAVGGVAEKAIAAAESGAKIFLVPQGQAVIYVPVERKTNIGGFEVITYDYEAISLQEYLASKGFNVQVIEVSYITEVLAYILE